MESKTPLSEILFLISFLIIVASILGEIRLISCHSVSIRIILSEEVDVVKIKSEVVVLLTNLSIFSTELPFPKENIIPADWSFVETLVIVK